MNILKKISIYMLYVSIFIGLFTTGVLADGTEHLGTPSVSIASGSGIIAKGTGLLTQPGTIDIDVPIGATVEQVLLYWEGQHQSVNGDNAISIDGNIVTGTLIGGPLFSAT